MHQSKTIELVCKWDNSIWVDAFSILPIIYQHYHTSTLEAISSAHASAFLIHPYIFLNSSVDKSSMKIEYSSLPKSKWGVKISHSNYFETWFTKKSSTVVFSDEFVKLSKICPFKKWLYHFDLLQTLLYYQPRITIKSIFFF